MNIDTYGTGNGNGLAITVPGTLSKRNAITRVLEYCNENAYPVGTVSATRQGYGITVTITRGTEPEWYGTSSVHGIGTVLERYRTGEPE